MDDNLERFIGTLKKQVFPLAAITPLAGAAAAALAWGLARIPPAGEDLTPVFLAAGIVSACLGLALALVFRNNLLRSAGTELVRTVSECTANQVSAGEAKEIFAKMGEMLSGFKQAEQVETVKLGSAVAEISGLLDETDTVVGLAREKIARMAAIAASATGSEKNNALKGGSVELCLEEAAL